MSFLIELWEMLQDLLDRIFGNDDDWHDPDLESA